ncbi:antibiotic biosynthesis monooxygenase [Paraburkholderia sp.]|uniref:putative quinol monooxygenase n=1 Tax=Paraburkholderia sp. TaxID=1926495 RepID=UPI0023A0E218|nr:antibiotic biosynthesis monooxygenase [Paraburkholderia sp.]MDE1179879.1 antibiotic biosynthesis monooxygenase [Paraburkholderia sp.]
MRLKEPAARSSVVRKTWTFAAIATAVVAGLTAHAATVATAADTSQPVAPFENLATLHVKHAELASFEQALRRNATDARHAPGNISFTIFQSRSAPDTLYVLEQWKDAAAYNVHMAQPALLAMHEAAKADLDGPISHMRIVSATPGDGFQPKQVDGAAQTSNVLVFLSVKPDASAQFHSDIAAVTPTFRAAPGNISFDIYQNADDPNQMVQLERWTTDATHDANLKRPVISTIRADYALTLAKPMMNGRVLLKDITSQ